MRSLIAGAAAVALAATVAHADPGKNKGNGNGKPSAAAQQRGGPDKAKRNQREKASPAVDKAERRGERRVERQVERRIENDRTDRREDTRDRRSDRREEVSDRREVRAERREDRGDAVPKRFEREAPRDRRSRTVGRGERYGLGTNRPQRGLIGGCPPGLAKKNNGCMPPGLARKREEGRYRPDYYRPDYFGYGFLGEGRYFYYDGYLFRLDGSDRISGWIPLLGGALSAGNIWPDDYRSAPLPDHYVDYYNLGRPQAYRYADDVIYRVDPETAAITSVAALLTGDDFVVGRPMPAGYDVYNVPYAYRDTYYDRPDALYRYSDGYVYQVDPETMLVASAIELLI